ncbi:MAG TPA: agmatine deiminase family protein [Bryobacteraceae bacterium]|nr:agmatine deiminase family protein [Bryobacteraceae bacterium]
MPAEWEPHEATWLAWPHEITDWPGKFAPIPWVYGDIVRRLARVEKVRILVEDGAAEQKARRVLKKCAVEMGAVEFFQHPTNRSWTRDYCPIFVHDAEGGIAVTDWIFNGWAKYDNWASDNQIPGLLAEGLRIPLHEPGIVLEGGAIDVNGEGVLLATEECLLSPVQARNPSLGREEIERVFAEYLGIERTIWLEKGIPGDDTHGHVDDVARFVNRETVVTVIDDLALHRAGLKVVMLPMPEPVWFDGQLLPASYANFYIANGLVLVPTFNDPNDRVALNTLAALFPDREVVGISCVDLVLGLGTLHCMTMQQPSETGRDIGAGRFRSPLHSR